MNPIKEKNIVAVCLMDETDTNKLWQLIQDNFPGRSWDNIEETVFHRSDANTLYALRILQAACLDDRQHWEYVTREKAIRDYNQGLLEAEERGWSVGEKAGIEKGIQALILDNLEEQVAQEGILRKLQKRFSLSEKEAKQYYEQYSKLE